MTTTIQIINNAQKIVDNESDKIRDLKMIDLVVSTYIRRILEMIEKSHSGELFLEESFKLHCCIQEIPEKRDEYLKLFIEILNSIDKADLKLKQFSIAIDITQLSARLDDLKANILEELQYHNDLWDKLCQAVEKPLGIFNVDLEDGEIIM